MIELCQVDKGSDADNAVWIVRYTTGPLFTDLLMIPPDKLIKYWCGWWTIVSH